MNQNVSLLTVAQVLLVLCLFLAGIFYLNQQALTVDRINLMAPHPDGSAVVMMGRDLYKINPTSNAEEVISLSALGIDSTLGGFAFFSNGDLLVLPDRRSPTLIDGVAIYSREENAEYTSTGLNQLLRCDLKGKICKPFSSAQPDFSRTFRVHIDHPSDSVYIADTSRHRLIKLDGDGNQLAINSDFKFPNQLRMIDGELWVADTNHHQVVRVEEATDSFGVLQKSHFTETGYDHRWPSDLARVGDQWWVLIMVTDMKDGRIVRFDSDWKRIKTLPLPDRADPLALLSVKDVVLVTDQLHFALYRFDLNGERLMDISYPRLQQALASAHEKYRSARRGWLGLWVLFVVAIAYGMRHAIRSIPEVYEPVELKLGLVVMEIPASGVWLKTSLIARLVIYALLVMLAIIYPLLLVVMLFQGSGFPLQLFVASSCMVLGLLVVLWPITKLLSYMLGLFPEELVFVNSEGFQFREKYSDLKWTEGYVKVGPNVVTIPQGLRRGLFPVKQIRALLIPRLAGNRHVNHWLMIKYQLKSPDKSFRNALLTVILCGACIWLPEAWHVWFS